ncbi:LysR substrate-binding domain-containing protein [Pandoraea sp.]|uniref:LysR substrate-binding domain-containing protein n=1 Tax=Pandoraea sp. TaxID=1883445 RepID=UPI001221C494|nr:LysR substrate-binding domain-containing protein [Pandoraea sp.]TAL53182.1 MAG: LysR family transcriptional regulator [Pandoraea sp.]TAM20610.1 MAG: LysR family transcriptional regulator [Pandoraea sp.]
MPFRLPPLTSLRFFEVAGRLQSFKLAAAELNVTPSAVSHGIVSLEQALGVELFVREARALSLTPAGADYLTYVAEAFALLVTGTQRLAAHRAERTIAVSCAPTLASRWLLPRLQRFRRRWPQVNVRVDTSRRQVGFPADGFDFAIRLSRAPDAGADWTRLFGEQLVPVCSPAYRDVLAEAAGQADLHRATLIHVDSASEDWQAWCDAAGMEGIALSGGLHVDSIQLAFEAAAAGLGVALGRYPMVERELAAGLLVEISPARVATQTAYWLVCADGADERPDLAGFKQWLVSEAEEFTGASEGTAVR